ncbi:ABC transporter substrate-binding protein [Thalassospira marina]|uniref:ABC transporter substrate-binding protein n=1 Tax=Thalassospira marina TaxID=2048283 RepID=A0ABM6QDG1_9PROT|nr:ABC transporter substrate-binding protein [Thalassospira marina]AUG54232.1 ABC transporter substrate-binding protein [Thalassospira marina]
MAVVLAFAFGAKSSHAVEFGQAPLFADQVKNNHLPPVEDRLPRTPMIVSPVDNLGNYGGTWHMAQLAERDYALLIRTIGYEPLLRWTPQWTGIIPNVALSFQTNDNATDFTFRLRPGMRWSDGHPFSADDIVFWYEDILQNPALTQIIPDWLTCGGQPVQVEKVDDYTVKFHFAAPYGLFSTFLAQPEGVEPVSYPAHYLKEYLPKYNPKAEAEAARLGYGSWEERFVDVFGHPGSIDDPSRWLHPEVPTLNAWVMTGVYGKQDPLIATRNPYYWKIDPTGRQLPYIDTVSFKLVGSKPEAIKLAMDGQIDMQERHISNSTDEILARRKDMSSFTLIESDMNKMTMSLNLNNPNRVLRTLFQDKNFRVGLSHAFDRDAIIDQFMPEALPHQAAPRPESPLFHSVLARQFITYDPDLALDYFAKAGLVNRDGQGFLLTADGHRVTFNIDTVGSSRFEMLQAVTAYWRKLGIDVNARDVPRDQFYEQRSDNSFDATAWGGDGGLDAMLIPINYLPISKDSWFAPAWAAWYLDHDNAKAVVPPRVVQKQLSLYDKLKSTADAEQQKDLMRAILDISADQFYVMGVALPPNRKGIVANNFKNVPKVIPAAWSFATPAPTNPSQYYIEDK